MKACKACANWNKIGPDSSFGACSVQRYWVGHKNAFLPVKTTGEDGCLKFKAKGRLKK